MVWNDESFLESPMLGFRSTSRTKRTGPLRAASLRVAVALSFVIACVTAAMAYTILSGGTSYSQAEITQMFANSSNSYLSQNATLYGQVSRFESGGTFNTGVSNGMCCTGIMQFNSENVRKFGGVNTPEQFAQLSGQQQVDAYTRYFDRVSQESGAQRLMQMQRNGESLGGRPVDAATITGCVQFGNKNCNAAINNNCSNKANGSGGDGYVTVCGFADKVRQQPGTSNPGKNGDNQSAPGGCTTPTDPKAATTPGNIGAGDGSGNTTTPGGTTTGGGGTDSTRTGGGTSGGTTTPGTPETPSKSVPCKSAESKATDKTSKTCQPTMQMINALQCSNFPASIQSFCQQYKPKLMTSEECTRAEKMAEKEKKGERQTECENQTFATPGTSAWSYVLACSFTQKNQGTFGSATQASGSGAGSSGSSGSGQPTTGSGVASDPQCVERLKKRIPNLKVLGAVETHGNGMTCGVKSGVSWTEISGVPTGYLEGECGMAEKFADFVDAMKAKGVTKMTNIGSFDKNCRWIRNSKGTIVGKVSRHAYGQAIDINGFVSGGQMMSTGKYWSDPTIKAYMSGVRQVACGIFEGVLGPIFYAGKYTHFHLQVGQRTRCDPPP